mgnify:CR=1 FL=1
MQVLRRSHVRLIRINIYYVDIFTFSKFFVDANLRLYALFVLSVRTEPNVYYSVFQFTSEKIYFSGKTINREKAVKE